MAAEAGVARNTRGLMVREVDPDGRAAGAGIEQGDIITEVNRTPVDSVEALRDALRKTPDRPVLLLVNRDGQDRFVTVRRS